MQFVSEVITVPFDRGAGRIMLVGCFLDVGRNYLK